MTPRISVTILCVRGSPEDNVQRREEASSYVITILKVKIKNVFPRPQT